MLNWCSQNEASSITKQKSGYRAQKPLNMSTSERLYGTLYIFSAMQLAASNFAEAFKEVYEEDWTCRDKVCGLFKVSKITIYW